MPQLKQQSFQPNCKIRITKPLCGVYPEYQPVVGMVYDARCSKRRNHIPKRGEYAVFWIIQIADKMIIVRQDECETVGGIDGN